MKCNGVTCNQTGLKFEVLFENLYIEDKKSTLFPLSHSWWRITMPQIATQTTSPRKRYIEKKKKKKKKQQ